MYEYVTTYIVKADFTTPIKFVVDLINLKAYVHKMGKKYGCRKE